MKLTEEDRDFLRTQYHEDEESIDQIEKALRKTTFHTVEDTDATREQIEKKFGSRVAELVAAESENKREEQAAEDTWKTRKSETVEHLRHCDDRDVKILALADKLSNLRAIYRDHRAMGEKLWDRFNQKDPGEIGWYYGSFRETCAALADTAAYMEYAELLDKVFPEKA